MSNGPWIVPTGIVVIVNDAEVDPAGTVTLTGTEADGLTLARATTAPPVAAAPASVTVPFEDTPPKTLEGLTVSLEGVAPRTVSGAVKVTA